MEVLKVIQNCYYFIACQLWPHDITQSVNCLHLIISEFSKRFTFYYNNGYKFVERSWKDWFCIFNQHNIIVHIYGVHCEIPIHVYDWIKIIGMSTSSNNCHCFVLVIFIIPFYQRNVRDIVTEVEIHSFYRSHFYAGRNLP